MGTRIQLLGGFAVVDDGVDVTPPPGLPAQALKAVACGGRRLHWEELVEVLWPSDDAERGRTRLRNVLSRLRARSGPLLVRDGDAVLIPAGLSLDAEEFEAQAREALELAARDRAAALARAGAAVAGYRGDLLPDDRYASWTQSLRERLRRRHRALLDLLIEDARQRGALEEALLLIERAMEAEPEAEELYVAAAEVLDETGRRSAALKVLRRGLEATRELGLQPGEPLREAVERFRVDQA